MLLHRPESNRENNKENIISYDVVMIVLSLRIESLKSLFNHILIEK